VVITAKNSGGANQPLYYSTDGGAGWREIKWTADDKAAVTYHTWGNDNIAAKPSALAFDPHYPNKVWMTDWYSIWVTEDITEVPAKWRSYEWGHEEVVVQALMSTTDEDTILFSGVADVTGFRHESLQRFPTREEKFPVGTSLGMQDISTYDFCEENPDFVVVAGLNRSGNNGQFRGRIMYSTDGGKTWEDLKSKPIELENPKPVNGITFGSHAGKVAVSARAKEDGTANIVWLPRNSNKIYYTTDLGETWHESDLPGGGDSPFITNLWLPFVNLCSDRVNGDKFYFYNNKTGGFYRSDDGGAHFVLQSVLPVFEWAFVEAAPGMENEVWVCLDKNDYGNLAAGAGLYRSSDGGKTFTRIDMFDTVRSFSFGKNKPGSDNPSLYVFGRLAGATTEGYYRSDDMGTTWVKLGNAGGYGIVKVVEADRKVYGRVFAGTDGRGYFYAVPEEKPVWPENKSLTATDVTRTGLTLNWNAAIDNSNIDRYKIYKNDVPEAVYYIQDMGRNQPDSFSYSISNLDPGKTYTFRVEALDLAGNESTDGPVLIIEPAAEKPDVQFEITNTSISKENGISVVAEVSPKEGCEGGKAAVIFRLMRGDTVIGVYSSMQIITDTVKFNVQFHGYSGDEYKVKIFVWDKLDNATDSIGVNLAEPVEIQ